MHQQNFKFINRSLVLIYHRRVKFEGKKVDMSEKNVRCKPSKCQMHIPFNRIKYLIQSPFSTIG